MKVRAHLWIEIDFAGPIFSGAKIVLAPGKQKTYATERIPLRAILGVHRLATPKIRIVLLGPSKEGLREKKDFSPYRRRLLL